MELLPGERVGPFVLGTPLDEALRQARALGAVEVLYSDERPLEADVILKLPAAGLRLRFDAATQRLRVIDVVDPPACALRSGRRMLDVPTFLDVYESLGPTFPGAFDAAVGAYVLRYSGLVALFPIPEQFRALYAEGAAALPNELPDGSTPACQRLFVFSGDDLAAPASCGPAPVEVRVALRPLRVAVAGRGELAAGASPQDAVAALGEPASTLAKPRPPGAALHSGGTFYNYPALGMDLLFDGEARLCKAVLHANAPGHPSFGSARRCHFRVAVDGAATLSPALGPVGAGGDCSVELTPSVPWAAVQRRLRSKQLQPAVNSAASTEHPFGASHFYAFEGAIVEVTANGVVAGVTVY